MPDRPSYEELEARIREFEQAESERKRTATALRESEERARRQRAAIADLTLGPDSGDIDLPHSFRKVCEMLSRTLDVARTSVWKLSGGGAELRCLNLYEAERHAHSCGVILDAIDMPGYFDAIKAESRVYAEDAQNDPRTLELADTYLKPIGITSMLDAGIQIDGKLVGVVCCEHIGKVRQWHPDEESFVVTAAAFVSQRMVESERKKTKEALLESEERYRALFERSMDCVYLHDFEGNFLDANDAALKFIGYDREDLNGLNFVDLLSERQMPQALATLQELQETGYQKQPTRFFLRRKDGERVEAETLAAIIYRGGKPHAIQGIARDITERRRSEAYKNDLELYSKLTPLGIIIFDNQFNITSWNPGAETIFGFTAQEVIGRNTFDILVPEWEHEKVKKIHLISEPKVTVNVNDNTTKDGRIITVQWFNSPRFDADGKLNGLIAACQDITAGIKAEEALRRSEEYLRYYKFAVDSMRASMIAVVDGDYRHKIVNKAYVEAYRKRAEQVIGTTVADLVGQEAFERFYKTGIDRSLAGKPWNQETWRDNRGAITYMDMFCYPIEGRREVAIILNDVTERKQAEEALRVSEEKLLRSKKMESLGLLAGGVAHDLNNVLSGVVSYPELILMDLPRDSALRKPLETIQQSGNRATAIVQDLLTVARGVANTKESLNVNAVIEDYLKSPEFANLRQLYPAVSVRRDLDEHLHNILASPVHVRKVVMNLVANASEAMERGGVVVITTRNREVGSTLDGYDDVHAGEYAALAVSDNGPGISSEDLERIFEPFYTKKVMGRSGIGLGLAVVWNVVQDHEGYIDVRSDGNGTTFELYFPTTDEEIHDKALALPIEAFRGNGELILVVDDVETQREISTKMLETLGYKTKAVASGEEAVAYLSGHNVDLLLLDMLLGRGINGRETFERIKKLHPGQKAVIISGYAATDEVKETQKIGAGKYIKKPFTLETLGMAVKEELGDGRATSR